MQMNQWSTLMGCAIVLICLVGCDATDSAMKEPDSENPFLQGDGGPAHGQEPNQDQERQAQPGGNVQQGEIAAKQELRGTGRPQPELERPPPAQQEQWPIRLSAGVALPQSLPTGTQIGFSVDYQFHIGSPDPAGQYVWEIKTGDGTIRRVPVQLTGRKGTLNRFMPLRPSDGPFVSRIASVTLADGPAEPLTDWVGMR